jgi:hypothetical protein
MSIENDTKLLKLQCTFPKLTEENQQYILGLAEGLKHAQGEIGKGQDNGADGQYKGESNGK